jgi:hypothetical protein
MLWNILTPIAFILLVTLKHCYKNYKAGDKRCRQDRTVFPFLLVFEHVEP